METLDPDSIGALDEFAEAIFKMAAAFLLKMLFCVTVYYCLIPAIIEGLMFESLSSGLISITNPMQSAMLCGAWSDRTRNFYQHYDKKRGRVVKHARTCEAQNAAEVFLDNGRTAVSIHQFMLENNPCVEGIKDRAYIRAKTEHSRFRERFELLKRLARGEAVMSGGASVEYEELPDFLALYIDDIDTLGHNNPYGEWPARGDFEERQRDICQILCEIQGELAELVDVLKRRGLFERTSLLITTDHGMTPFFGKSMLPDVIERLERAGFSAALPDDRIPNTDIVALPYTIELSLYFTRRFSACERDEAIEALASADYTDRVFDKREMARDFGVDKRGPDLLVSPVRGAHFYRRDISGDTFGASHDSFDESSRHIFGMLIGGGVRRIGAYHTPVSAIDLLPSIMAARFGYTMRDSCGRIFTDWYAEPLKTK